MLSGDFPPPAPLTAWGSAFAGVFPFHEAPSLVWGSAERSPGWGGCAPGPQSDSGRAGVPLPPGFLRPLEQVVWASPRNHSQGPPCCPGRAHRVSPSSWLSSEGASDGPEPPAAALREFLCFLLFILLWGHPLPCSGLPPDSGSLSARRRDPSQCQASALRSAPTTPSPRPRATPSGGPEGEGLT